MMNYKQILEAINRGVQLALDDFDDENQVQNIKSRQIQNRDYTKEYLDLLRDEVIDLGLPSGTLWCKYNLGVDLTQLSKAEDWYGKYYAWGELEGNKTNKDGEIYFSWGNYKFGKDYNKLTKYCNNPKYGLNGFTDNLTELLPEDDVAYQNKKLYNFKFHIPTKEQFEELIHYTKSYWVDNYDPNNVVHYKCDDGIKELNGRVFGLNGRIFEGNNGNQLFIPAAGYRSNSNNYSVGSDCGLWSSSLSLDTPSRAYYLYFSSGSIGIYGNCRYWGLFIRPVINL